MEIIIEEISRNHKLISRHRFAQKSVSIGRSYQNDMILSDPHICAEHLQICYNGEQWVLRDNNSVNGSYLEHSKNPISVHHITSGDVILLGKRLVRIIFPDHPIPPSILFTPLEGFINLAKHPAFLIGNILLFMAITAGIFHLNQIKPVNFTHLLVPTISAALLFSLWPLGVALVSHFTKNDARPFSQLGVAFLFFNLFYLSDFIEKFLSFNFSSDAFINTLALVIPLSLAGTLFWLNCHIGFHLSNRRRIIVASALTLLLFGGSHLLKLSKQPEFTPHPRYNATLMEPSYNINEGISVKSFLSDTEKVFTQAEKQIADK